MILLLGSKEEVPQKPTEPVKFIEDMDEDEVATAVRANVLPISAIPNQYRPLPLIIACLVAGIAGRPKEFGQHLLYECHSSVLALGSGIAGGSECVQSAGERR